MSNGANVDYQSGLITELRKLSTEVGWAEFKENNFNPEDIGEYISALSNTAALNGKTNAYVVWGIKDGTHEVVGTTFKPSSAKKGNENLENWLVRMLSPRLHFHFFELDYEGKPVVLLEIPRASGKPTQFSGTEFVRIGSCRQKLKDHPQLERDLWRFFETTPFEQLLASERLDSAKVLTLLDYPRYFDLLSQPLPADSANIISRLADDELIAKNGAGSWDITNLGAIRFAKNLDSFKGLSRKAVRVIVYEGKNRLKTKREQDGRKGYASGFEGLIEFVNALLPRNEVVGKALRKDVPMYPEPAVRECVDPPGFFSYGHRPDD